MALRLEVLLAAVVADMTPIAQTDQGKQVANPNVLIELGYAMKAIGPERIVLVANTAWGGTAPENLPFDLRHRRGPITYRLKRDAHDEEIAGERRVLASKLAPAITSSMRSFMGSRDAATRISGHPERTGDPSVWFSKGEPLEYCDSLGGAGVEKVEVVEGPRAYMRIIPAGWKGEPPRLSDVDRVPSEIRVSPLGDYSGADCGRNGFGFLATEVRGSNVQRTRTAAQLFVQTGELWGFDGKAVDDSFLASEYVVRQWYRFLRRGVALLRHLGAVSLIRVEAGVAGLEGVRWPGRFSMEKPISVKSAARAGRQSSEWDDDNMAEFVARVYNEVRDAFGLPRASQSDVDTMISR